ncbi:MAG TPA: type II toxin-antitoxin system HicA family toxin [Treponemataceae bacterium]|jgi:hypothetical protein|nr:type II toxin-antitoxin system HicA family toxin [Treponemataceae bacterium]
MLTSSTTWWYYIKVNSKNRKILEGIFKQPTPSNILWADIELLFLSLGAEITEGNGSRVRVKLHGARAVFHRPHPDKNTDKGAVNSVKRFLKTAGVNNDGI